MKRFCANVTVAVLSLGAAASTAQAVSITAHFGTPSPRHSVNYSSDGGSSWENYDYAGVYNLTRSSTSGSNNDYVGPPAPGDAFNAFCIEIDQDVYLNHSYTWDVVDLTSAPDPGTELGGAMDQTRADQISNLWHDHHGDATTSGENAAAFQLAIWEITYDGDASLNLDDGDFQAKNAGVSTAQGWLDGVSANGPMASLSGLTNPDRQDLVFSTLPDNPSESVPVPATAWTGLALLGLLGWTSTQRRWRGLRITA